MVAFICQKLQFLRDRVIMNECDRYSKTVYCKFIEKGYWGGNRLSSHMLPLLYLVFLCSFYNNNKTESILITAQNNVIRTNHIKTRIDKTQQNSKCRLYGDRDETINHIISKCSKLAQKEYKTRYNWVGKVIFKELCKKF